jgi:hypothetical protein
MLFLCRAALTAATCPDGYPFEAKHIELRWSAPTNQFLTGLWVYRSIPQKFAPAVISNVMHLAGFTMRNKTKPPREPGEKFDSSALYFANKEETRHLGFFPTLGWIDYADSTARASMKEPVINVPSEDEALALALKYLHLLGVDRSQLATLPGTTNFRIYREVRRRSKMDKLQNRPVTEVHSRGVFFVRRIDNVEFTGIGNAGGFLVTFGNEGRIIELQLLWRNFEPYRSYEFPTPAVLMDRIKNGLTTFTNPPKELDRIKKITIHKVTPYYMGLGGDERKEFLYPFLGIDVGSDLGTTNVLFDLNCPIVLEK